jgi:hypothetical protein
LITISAPRTLDLPDAAEHFDVPGKARTTNRHANAVTVLGQRLHDLGADKARAAKNGDEFGFDTVHHDAPAKGCI